MTRDAVTNPFDHVKASDFSDEQIDRYWVDIAGESGLEDLFQPTLVTPMLVLGGKGSGKTHLMRYFSAAVRKLRQASLLAAAKSDRYLGIYIQADGLNAGRFHNKGASDEKWAAVFSFYFELWLATHFLRNVSELSKDDGALFDESLFVGKAFDLFTTSSIDRSPSLAGLIDHITAIRKEVDHVVANMVTNRRALSEIDICFAPGTLAFELPLLFQSCLDPSLKDLLFVYMVDEVENFTATQQTFLNSLIRYRKGPVSIKIGARLYGLRTKDTMGGSGEMIRIGAEYTQIELDDWLRENGPAYSELARKMICKRLEAANLIAPDGGNPPDVRAFFAELDSSNHYRKPLFEMVAKFDTKGNERPYFDTLKKQLSKRGTSDDIAATDDIIAYLRIPEYPLLEKVNIYLLYRDWSSADSLLERAQGIAESAREFLAGAETEGMSDYEDTYKHFKSDFVAQIYRDCRVQKTTYAGLDTLIRLSQGFPRNLLGLLKEIFRRSLFAGEQPFQPGKVVSIESQSEGVRDAAAWFWDDAQPDSHGPEARRAIQGLAELFSAVRFSLKPAECSLGTFTVGTAEGSERARTVLRYAQNWSYLIQIKGVGSDRNNADAVDDKYQLSPMLAPRWDVSERRRGAIRLREPLFNAIFDPTFRESLDGLVSERLSGMQDPGSRSGKTSRKQNKLF